MKSKKMKQALALLCAGAMTVTGMNLPVNVMSTDAAADWTWNALVSESGYRKVPFKELSAIADTEAASEGDVYKRQHQQHISQTSDRCNRRQRFLCKYDFQIRNNNRACNCIPYFQRNVGEKIWKRGSCKENLCDNR